MRYIHNLLALPASLLLLVLVDVPLSHAVDVQLQPKWPYDRPANVEYLPEDPPHPRRDPEEVHERIPAGYAPVAVRKMGVDEDEKFWPDYWGFPGYGEQHELHGATASDKPGATLRREFKEDDRLLSRNSSAAVSFRPAFAAHLAPMPSDLLGAPVRAGLSGRSAAAALGMLQKRDYQCPSNTLPCTNINPNLCCAPGETCITIQDSGLGTVGCCPQGATCSGNISCAQGNLGCASNIGGGCCISGYVCQDVGCVPSPVTVVNTITQSASSSSTSTTVVTSVILVITTSTATTASTTSSSTETNTAIQTTLSCGCGFQACPLNLGGGCCPTGQLCGPSNICSSPSSGQSITLYSTGSCPTTSPATTASPAAPARATDAGSSSSTSSSAITGNCPTGYYACSAFYGGGCCRTGRDCASTNCPATSYTTIISSGVTIAVPLTGAATTLASASCAQGWTSCTGASSSGGGGCCMSGWSCAVDSCFSPGASATATGPKGVAAVGSGAVRRRAVWVTREGVWDGALFGLVLVLVVFGWRV